MKVLCIDKKPPISNKPWLWAAFNKLNIGDTYEVVGEGKGADTGRNLYELAEFPPVDNHRIGFKKEFFIPLSDIDESNMKRNYNNTIIHHGKETI